MSIKKLKYYLFILGCQMNYSDAERLSSVLENIGYQKTADEKEADLIITVACSVRQTAIDRIHGKIKIWHKLKKTKPLIIAITGCLLPTDKKSLTKKFDLIFDITKLPDLPKLLNAKSSKLVNIKNYFDIKPLPKSTFQIAIPIMTGCNNFCTYCAVPYTRGREISRPSQDIIKEVKYYLNNGYKEITLLGQNVNSYGQDLDGELTFPQLLKKINDLPGEWWLRFITSHPKDMSNELIQVMAERGHLGEYLHLPVQTGADKILKRMNRKYNICHYKNLIKKIRRAVPKITLTTDTIVGFPGETKWQFHKTKKLYKKIKYEMAYINKYSPRAGTVATQWKDNVSWAEKKKREKILTKIMAKSAYKANQKLIGQTITMLAEKYTNNLLSGKTKSLKSIQVFSDQNLVGQFVKVKITSATAYNLQGKKESH